MNTFYEKNKLDAFGKSQSHILICSPTKYK